MFVPGSRKNKYVKDYQINEQGSYEYFGSCFRWADADGRKKVLRDLWILTVLSLALTLAAGCIPSPGVNSESYLLIPYAASAAVCVWCALSLWRMTSEGDPLRDHVFNSTAKKLPARYLIVSAASFAGAFAEAVYISKEGAGGLMLYAAGFIIMEAGVGIFTLICRRIVARLKWISSEHETKNIGR